MITWSNYILQCSWKYHRAISWAKYDIFIIQICFPSSFWVMSLQPKLFTDKASTTTPIICSWLYAQHCFHGQIESVRETWEQLSVQPDQFPVVHCRELVATRHRPSAQVTTSPCKGDHIHVRRVFRYWTIIVDLCRINTWFEAEWY